MVGGKGLDVQESDINNPSANQEGSQEPTIIRNCKGARAVLSIVVRTMAGTSTILAGPVRVRHVSSAKYIPKYCGNLE
jgi:hypothetical protein